MECKCQTCYCPLQGRALGFASRSADNLDSRQAGSVLVLPHALPGKTPLDSCSAVFFWHPSLTFYNYFCTLAVIATHLFYVGFMQSFDQHIVFFDRSACAGSPSQEAELLTLNLLLIFGKMRLSKC